MQGARFFDGFKQRLANGVEKSYAHRAFVEILIVSFPAPFGPIRPKISLLCNSKETSFRTCNPRKFLPRFEISRSMKHYIRDENLFSGKRIIDQQKYFLPFFTVP